MTTNDENNGPFEEVHFIPPREPKIRVFGFRCEACRKPIGIYRFPSQDPPQTNKERAEIQRSAQAYHNAHSCRVKSR